MVNKIIAARVAPQQSACMNILHKENGLSIRKIHKKFPQFSLSTVYRHATKVYGDRDGHRAIKKTGRPKKVSARDERKAVRTLQKLRKMDGSVTSKKNTSSGRTYAPF